MGRSRIASRDHGKGKLASHPILIVLTASLFNRIDVQSDGVVEEAAPTPRPEQPKETSSEGPTKYRPPGMRHQSQHGSSAPSRLRQHKGVAPDIHNEDYFPTLNKSGDNKK